MPFHATSSTPSADGTRIALVGAGGMLGRAVARECAARGAIVIPYPGRDDLDVADAARVRGLLRDAAPRVVINASGYTDVNGAEDDPDTAFRVNCDGAARLAETCRDLDALLVHFSTDYVFDGRARVPYDVTDAPAPLNVYGASKLAGERAIRATGAAHLILRTSWLFAAHGRNFVRAIVDAAIRKPEIDVVVDQVGRPTCCRSLAEMTLDLVEVGATGTLHAANTGHCSRHELASDIVTMAGLECRVLPGRTVEDEASAPRPRYSVLDVSGTARRIGRPVHWRPRLRACLEALRPGGVFSRAEEPSCAL